MTPTTPVRYYSLDEAVKMCGFPSVRALRTFLWRYRDFAAPRYCSRGFRSVRLISEYEIDAIKRARVK
jgi:hypothetical protein